MRPFLPKYPPFRIVSRMYRAAKIAEVLPVKVWLTRPVKFSLHFLEYPIQHGLGLQGQLDQWIGME